MNVLRHFWNKALDAFDGEDGPDEVRYDPVAVGGIVVGCLAAFGVLFWLLWALLVCEGGLFVKIGPFLQVVFTSKTLRDFGYEGFPYQLGIFEGWIVNAAALVLCVALVVGLWKLWVDTNPGRRKTP
jgi:hypothetical protein